jgi:hypothetical protein
MECGQNFPSSMEEGLMKCNKWDLSSRGFPMNRLLAVAIAFIHRATDSLLKLIGFLKAHLRKASPAEGGHSAG